MSEWLNKESLWGDPTVVFLPAEEIFQAVTLIRANILSYFEDCLKFAADLKKKWLRLLINQLACFPAASLH